MTIGVPGGLVATATVFGNFQAPFGHISASALSAAIRNAVAALAASAAATIGTLLPGLVVGTLSLFWPSTLGNGERHASLALPLADLNGPDDQALDAAVIASQPIALPYATNLRNTEAGIAIEVVAARPDTPILATVLDLQLDAETGHYEAVVDVPPRIITVTPAVSPPNASTELPAEENGPSVLTGPAITLRELSGNITPGYEALDVEVFILRYPAHTGLPAVYLAVQKTSHQSPSSDIEFESYEQARNSAVQWLTARGFKAEKLKLGKFKDIENKPIGMQSTDNKTGYRIEYDERNGAHINVWSGKVKGPHFKFPGDKSYVDKLTRSFEK